MCQRRNYDQSGNYAIRMKTIIMTLVSFYTDHFAQKETKEVTSLNFEFKFSFLIIKYYNNYHYQSFLNNFFKHIDSMCQQQPNENSMEREKALRLD